MGGLVLERVEVAGFRNLSNVVIPIGGSRVVVYGANGAGKTSLLEALRWVATGKVTRGGRVEQAIQQGRDAMAVTVVYRRDGDGAQACRRGASPPASDAPGLRVAEVHWSREEGYRRRLDGRPCYQADIAQDLAFLPITSSSADEWTSAPDGRRRFLDFGCFYSDPAFQATWAQWRSGLKHRNAALRMDYAADAIAEIDRWLGDVGERVDATRTAFVERWSTVLHDRDPSVTVRYVRGWPWERTLADALGATVADDRVRGFTSPGPHRADLRVTRGGRSIKEWSRGEQRLFALNAWFALHEVLGRRGTLLIDDAWAELDARSRAVVMTSLQSEDWWVAQVEPSGPVDASAFGALLFHVEQGSVQRAEPSSPVIVA